MLCFLNRANTQPHQQTILQRQPLFSAATAATTRKPRFFIMSLSSFELKRWCLVADMRSHRCYDNLQIDLIACGPNQMRTQLDAAQLQLIVRQQIVHVKDAINARKIMRTYMNGSHVRNLVLYAGDEDANLPAQMLSE